MSRVRRKESPKTYSWIPRKSDQNSKILKPRQIEDVEPMATPEIFFRVFLNKYKLHNLIKRKICILITTTIKKNTQIYKVYNCLLRCFLIKCLSIILVKE